MTLFNQVSWSNQMQLFKCNCVHSNTYTYTQRWTIIILRDSFYVFLYIQFTCNVFSFLLKLHPLTFIPFSVCITLKNHEILIFHKKIPVKTIFVCESSIFLDCIYWIVQKVQMEVFYYLIQILFLSNIKQNW